MGGNTGALLGGALLGPMGLSFGSAADAVGLTAKVLGTSQPGQTAQPAEAPKAASVAVKDEKAQRAAAAGFVGSTQVAEPLGAGKRFGSPSTGQSFLFRNSPAATNNPAGADIRATVLGLNATKGS